MNVMLSGIISMFDYRVLLFLLENCFLNIVAQVLETALFEKHIYIVLCLFL